MVKSGINKMFKRVSIITMVQSNDFPEAFACVSTISDVLNDYIEHLILLNDTVNPSLIKDLAKKPNTIVYCQGYNMGVAGGRNYLINESIQRGAELIVSLDDDIIVPDDYIKILLDELEKLSYSGEKVGIVAPAVLDFNSISKLLFSENGIESLRKGNPLDGVSTSLLRSKLRAEYKTLPPEFIYHMGIGDWFSCYVIRDRRQFIKLSKNFPDSKDYYLSSHKPILIKSEKAAQQSVLNGGGPIEVATLPGGVCCYTAELIRNIGLLDEEFNPFGFEDSDFSVRALHAGYSNFCIPNALLIHDISGRLKIRDEGITKATLGKMQAIFLRKHVPPHLYAPTFLHVILHALEFVNPTAILKRASGNESIGFPKFFRQSFYYFMNFLFHLMLPFNVNNCSILKVCSVNELEAWIKNAITKNVYTNRFDGTLTCFESGIVLENINLKNENLSPYLSIARIIIRDLGFNSFGLESGRVELEGLLFDKNIPDMLKFLVNNSRKSCSINIGFDFNINRKDNTISFERGEISTNDTGCIRFMFGVIKNAPDSTITSAEQTDVLIIRDFWIQVRDDGIVASALKHFAKLEKLNARDWLKRFLEEIKPWIKANGHNGRAVQDLLTSCFDSPGIFTAHLTDGATGYIRYGGRVHSPYGPLISVPLSMIFQKRPRVYSENIDLVAREDKQVFNWACLQLKLKDKDITITSVPCEVSYPKINVVFIPLNAYHVWTMGLISRHLENFGINYLFLDIEDAYRNEGVRERIAKEGYPTLRVTSAGNPITLFTQCVFTMNDWNSLVQKIVKTARTAGIKTIALSEGVQDYLDVDTGRVRKPYRSCHYVLLPGEFDRRYFVNSKIGTCPVGVPRLDDLYNPKGLAVQQDLAVINVNFTYGVLTDKRKEWVDSVIAACKLANMKFIISKHYADDGEFPDLPVSNDSMYSLIRKGSVFISRFSTGLLEAMAMGRSVVYHNPHGEKIDKFNEPMGAYEVTDSVQSLAEALKRLKGRQVNPLQFRGFLEFHCEKVTECRSSERAANVLIDLLAFRDHPVKLVLKGGQPIIDKQVLPKEDFNKQRIVPLTTPVEMINLGSKLYEKIAYYLKTNHRTIARIGQFGMWSLRTLKRKIFGIEGLSVLLVLLLFTGASLSEQYRRLLVGGGSGFLLLLIGGLALGYGQFLFNRYANKQRRDIRTVADRINRDITKKVTSIQSSIDGLKKEINLDDDRIKEILRLEGSQYEQKLAGVKINIDGLMEEIKRVEGIQSTIESIKKEIVQYDSFIRKTNSNNFPIFQRFNRQLRLEDIQHFEKKWLPRLGLKFNAKTLGYFAHRICLTEDTCIGRLATSVEAELLRVLVARSIQEQDLDLLEIGTLFGVGVAAIHECCRGVFDNIHLTVIDPLDGYYGKNNVDILTSMPITYNNFLHNMNRMNIPKEQLTIIAELSTKDEAIKQAVKRQYNVLIIDGDHTRFGVKHDFYNYRRMVKRGGYIIFDDYNTSDWPDIKDFVDKEVMGLQDLEFIGADWRTAVFRVVNN